MDEDRIAVRFYNEVRSKGAVAIRELADLAEHRGDTLTRDGQTRSRAEILRETAHDLESNEFVIAVVGEFSRGKSSLINVLLNRDDLLPTSIQPSTAAITLLHYADSEYARVTYSDGTIADQVPLADLPKYVVGADLDGRKASLFTSRRLAKVKTEQDAEMISLPEIGKEYAQQVQGAAQKTVKFVDVFIQSSFLKDGLTLVDTPGIGSVNPEHGQATREYIGKADAVIFLINTDPVISDSECNFLLFLQDYVDQFVFAITKIDRFSDTERAQSVDYTRRTIEEFAGIEDPPMYPVSAKLMQEGRSAGDSQKVSSSGFPDFERGLEHYLIRERGRLLLQSTAREVRTELTDLQTSIESEMNHLSMTSEELHQRLEAMQRGIKDAGYVRQAVSRDIDKAIRGAEELVMGEFDWLRAKTTLKTEVSDEIDAYSWTELQRANELIPIFVKSRLDEVLASLLTRMSEHLSVVRSDAVDWAMETLAKLGQEVGVELGATQERPEWEISFKTASDAFVRTLRKVGTMTIGSTLALTVAGICLFGGVGAIAMLGGLLLGGGSTPIMLRKTKQQLKNDVLTSLESMMDQLLHDLKAEVVRDLNQFRNDIGRLLDGSISNVTNTVERLQEEHQEVGFDSDSRREDLQAQLTRLQQISDSLNHLRFFAGYIAGQNVKAG